MTEASKRFSGARKLKARPDLDIARPPEGGPKVDTQQEKARKKPYGFTEAMSDTPAKVRHSDGVTAPDAVEEILTDRS